MIAVAVSLPATALSKTVEVETSTTPPAVGPSASKANAVISADAAWLSRIFRELHDDMQNGRIEARVAGAVAAELTGWGFEVTFGADGTEVVAILHNGAGPTLLYRTDTGSDRSVEPRRSRRDASPGLEAQDPHRCGHDADVTWMLGMAKAMVTLRDEWAGTLVLVSQPTRLLRNGDPTFKDRGPDTQRLPRADMVLALSAAGSPIGSILSVRGQRRAGSETADLVLSRIGIYDAPRFADTVSQLAASTTRLYGLPEGAIFGYLLVGVANRQLGEDLASDLDATAFDAQAGADGLDLAAIPLGTKLATVAVLELLKKTRSSESERPPGAGREWTLHDY